MDLSFFLLKLSPQCLTFQKFVCAFLLYVQFYLVWTIFIVFDQHVLPVIHCLLTGKSDQLYQAVLSKIQEILPQFLLQIAMSDWEQAARNAFKMLFNGIKLRGCWFHYTQRIWRKVQKINLGKTHTNKGAFQNYLRCIMPLLFYLQKKYSLHTNELYTKSQSRRASNG